MMQIGFSKCCGGGLSLVADKADQQDQATEQTYSLKQYRKCRSNLKPLIREVW
jgi:hypothetical protein